MDELVSVIMPVHNDERFLNDSIPSVLSQTYKEWELIVVDDCSTDSSPEVIEAYCGKDPRIRCFKTERASGTPTLPRNIGIENARGRFIAFLDSDDRWISTKLEKQVSLFGERDNVLIVYSNYRKMDAEGNIHHGQVKAPEWTDYQRLLKGNVIGCLSAMYDTSKVGKRFFPYCGHEDYVLWLSILKEGGVAYNTNTIEALYRVRNSSVSSNKLRAMRWQWNIYTNIEKLGCLRSLYYFSNYAIKALNKQRK